jgi:triosephosphate isomerase
MRKKIVAGNWKMNTELESAIRLAAEIDEKTAHSSAHIDDVEIILFPPFPFIHETMEVINTERIKVGAQTCATEESGAYTGEVSAKMIASLQATHILVGHSERRQYYHEDSTILLKKAQATLNHHLTPVFCLGENLEQRKSNKHLQVIEQQLEEVIFKFSKQDFQKFIIAYEPVWAIGTGETASPEQAQEVHAFIRKLIGQKYDNKTADNMSILYGGSVKPGNANELFSQPDIDGGLIGGASLKSDDFLAIIESY